MMLRITVTAGASGAGNGEVAFKASKNGRSAAIPATLTIAGQTFTVAHRRNADPVAAHRMIAGRKIRFVPIVAVATLVDVRATIGVRFRRAAE